MPPFVLEPQRYPLNHIQFLKHLKTDCRIKMFAPAEHVELSSRDKVVFSYILKEKGEDWPSHQFSPLNTTSSC